MLSKRLVGLVGLWLVLACWCGIPAAESPSDWPEAEVIEVVDGDTIVVLSGGERYRVRYIGIDAPETEYSPRGAEPFGEAATEANLALVGGQTVRLEKDVSETDRYGRLLRYVWVDEVMVNEELLRQGMARAGTYPPDVKYTDRFRAIEQEARQAGIGLWAD